MSFFHKNEVKINLVNQQFNSKKCKSLCWGIFSQFILLMVGSRNSESTTWWCTYEKHINYSISCIQLKEIAISSVFPSSAVSVRRMSCWLVIPHNVSVNAWFMKICSWSLMYSDTAMTSMKVIFHLGNIIQLICWLHTCHTLFGVYIPTTCLKHKLVS